MLENFCFIDGGLSLPNQLRIKDLLKSQHCVLETNNNSDAYKDISTVVFYDNLNDHQESNNFNILISNEIQLSDSNCDYYLSENCSDLEFQKFLHILNNRKEKIKSNEHWKIRDKRMSVIGFLIGGIIHEVFSPLNSISGRIQFLEYMIKDDPNVRKTVSVSMEQIRRITDILRLVQEFSRYSENQKLSESDLSVIIEEAILLVTKFIKNYEVEIEFNHSDEHLETIKIDSNALRFMVLDFFLKCFFHYNSQKLNVKICERKIIIIAEEFQYKSVNNSEKYDFFLNDKELEMMQNKLSCEYKIEEKEDSVIFEIDIKTGEEHVKNLSS